jgi:polyisoprenoid-binding protein YceI
MPATLPSLRRLPTGVWRADPVHSSVEFSLKYMALSTFRSHFGEWSAELVVEEGRPARLTGTVRSASVAVRDPQFAAHLADAEFFDSDRYPQLRFESTLLRRHGQTVELEGLLTIKGHELPITAIGSVSDAREDPSGNAHMGLELESRIDRRQFGLQWNMALPKGGCALGNEVALRRSAALPPRPSSNSLGARSPTAS